MIRHDCLSSLNMRVASSFFYTNSLLELTLPAFIYILMALKMDLLSLNVPSSKKTRKEASNYSCRNNK